MGSILRYEARHFAVQYGPEAWPKSGLFRPLSARCAVVKRIRLAPKGRNMRIIKDQPSRLSASKLHNSGSSNCESVHFLEEFF